MQLKSPASPEAVANHSPSFPLHKGLLALVLASAFGQVGHGVYDIHAHLVHILDGITAGREKEGDGPERQ